MEKKTNGLSALSILSLSLVSMAITVVTPAMAVFAGVFPGQNITFISTLPTLFIVIATFIAGALMGKKVKYRTLAILGNLIALIGGVAPAIIGTPDSFTLLLVCRAVFGFGMGLISPLGNALIIGLYDGQKRASLLGYGTLCMNAGGIICQMLGGVLAGIDWKLTFWGHGFIAIALIMSFFIPEPPKVEIPKQSVSGNAEKPKLGSVTFIAALLLILFNLVNYPNMMNISILFETRNAGGAAAAATALSLYTVAGCVAGLIFGQIFKFAKRWCLFLGYLFCTAGSCAIYFGQVNIVMTLGLSLIGFGFSLIMPALMAWLGMATHPAIISTATAIVIGAMNIAAFISSFYVSLLTMIFPDPVIGGLLVAIVVFAITAVIFLVINPFKKMDAAPAPQPNGEN